MARPTHPALTLMGLLVYGGFCINSVTEVGLVGEVSTTWSLPAPPDAPWSLSTTSEIRSPDAPVILVARPTRPTERLEVGAFSVPLTVNAYTGGFADWPARLVSSLWGWKVGNWVIPVLGGLLLVLVARFLQFHGGSGAPGAAVIFLATDWSFVFYRKVLGGTELALQTALLLLLWAIWSRRWKGGWHGTRAIGLGIGMGLAAKITFVAPLMALGLSLWLTRHDRASLKPPEPLKIHHLLGFPLVFLLPQLISLGHHQALPALKTHDHLGLQLERLWLGWQGIALPREGLANLYYFLTNPLPFFEYAYHVPVPTEPPILKALGWLITLLGVGLAWKDRGTSAPLALLRLLSLLVPLELLAILTLNRDLHHLAQATLPLALLVGMAADRVAATMTPPGVLRAVYAIFLVLPHMIAGAATLVATDGVVAQVRTPTFTRQGQQAIAELLKTHQVSRVYVADYESYGVLEALAPRVHVVNLWPAVTHGMKGTEILTLARGGYLLVVEASMPFVYNWTPSVGTLKKITSETGIPVTEVGRVGEADDRHPPVVLYRVD